VTKPQIIRAKEISRFVTLNRIRELSIYNQPEFLELVAPGKAYYARVTNRAGDVAYFPFCGQNLIFKWRIFLVPYCQRFEPFCLVGNPDQEHWKAVFAFFQNQTIQCHWAFGEPDAFILPIDISLDRKTNQFLHLNLPFNALIKSWKPGRKAALKNSEALKMVKLNSVDFCNAFNFEMKQIRGKGWRPDKKEADSILRISDSVEFGSYILRFAVMEEDKVLSLVLLLQWNGRYHYLFSMSSDDGFATDSLTRFFYEFLDENSGSETTFDFEGSSLPGVHAFFKSLGAEEEHYYLFRL